MSTKRASDAGIGQQEGPPEKKRIVGNTADVIARKKREVEERLRAARESRAIATGRGQGTDKAPNGHRRLFRARDEEDDTPVGKARGGLGVGLHPALMANNEAKVRESGTNHKPMAPKLASVQANIKDRRSQDTQGRNENEAARRLEILRPEQDETSPFFDRRSSAQTKTRVTGRQLIFSPHGKYIEQANALRAQAQMEALKRRIAQASKRAGLDEDMDTTARAYKPPRPPRIEWWDSGLLTNETYDDLEVGLAKVDTKDSIITDLIQHPIPIPPPYEMNQPQALSVKLTRKEMRRIRRERREEVRREERDKQLLGLVPAPAPKVKISNMYAVYGEEAIKNPTKVEAEVRQQIQDRLDKHIQMNQERKLTPEERREKAFVKKQEDANKGIHVSLYRIDDLSHRPHRLKVDMNAQQDGLTGVCILNPTFNLVVVEGGPKGINHYKQLMTRRIDWTDDARNSSISAGNAMAVSQVAGSSGESQPINRCLLVWEGAVKDRSFRKWSFKRCETDDDAREALKTFGNADFYWDIAKNYKEDTY